MPYSSHCINTANLSNSPSSFSSRSPISDLPASFHIVSCIGISMFLRSPPFRGSGTAGSFRSPNSFGLGPFCGRRPPCRRVGRAWYYNRTTAAACTAPHPPTMYRSTVARTGTAVRDYVHAQVVCCGIALGFPCFYGPLAISGIGEGSFRRSPVAEFGVEARPFAEDHVVPPCGAGMARSCGLGGSAGARESRSKTGHSKTDSDVKRFVFMVTCNE